MEPIGTFIRECETAETPWLVRYAPYLPHQPHDSPERFYGMARSRPGVEEHELPYFASIAQFDETVGRLLPIVEEHGDPADTIFVFVADNGWTASRQREKSRPEEFAHTKTSERAPFDEGVPSPILIRWEGKVDPATHPELVGSIDLFPTLLKAAGLSGAIPANLPGVDLLGSLDPDRAVFGEVYPGDATVLGDPGRDFAYRFVRKGDDKPTVPRGGKPWSAYLEGEAVFDVVRDPGEQRNLAADPQLSEVLRDLRARLESWWRG